MQKIRHICFDLDGTLVDSSSTIYKATIKALRALKINAVIKEKEFNKMIGAHFINIFNDLNVAVKDVDKFIEIYKGFYFDFIAESEFYPGVEGILQYLKAHNYYITLLTTKNQDQAEKIIKHFNLEGYFSFIMGRRNGMGYKPSPEPLLFICNEINVRPEETMIVGDTELDIICGKSANALTCAVTYGYRTKDILKDQNPDYFISDLSKLRHIIEN